MESSDNSNSSSTKINNLKLARLSVDDRALVKAGVLDMDTLQLTEEGSELLLDLLFEENKTLVVKAITKIRDEDRKSKKSED